MSREEIEKLLGGYATGTLTPEERDALFAAALDDQQLFEALAREEPLRELLQDPVAKTRLLTALERKPEAGYWRWLRPAAWAIPAVGLAAVVVMLVVQRQAPRPVMIAQAPALPSLGPIAPVPSPVPQVLEKRQAPNLARAIKAVPVDSVQARDAAALPATPTLKDTLVQAQTGAPAAPPAPLPAAAPAPPAADKEVALNPPAARQQVAVEAAPQQQGQQGQAQIAGAGLGGAAQALQAGFRALPVQDARALFFGQQNTVLTQTNVVELEQRPSRKAATAPVQRVAATPVAQLGLRYTILRRLPNGQLAAVIPNEVLDAADQIEVRLEANNAGSLAVFERGPEGWRQLASSLVERLAPYTVPAGGTLTFDRPGPRDLFVVFSRQPQSTPYPVPEARLDQVINANLAERATYVVSTAAPAQAQTIAFPITLTHK